MKKITSIILAACLVLGLTSGTAYASSANLSAAQQTVQALGIMTGDENGNLNLTGNVTRAQLAKMMIAASTYKDTISSTAKSSPFKDVRYTHWSASYVQAAVVAGWMTGYTDGTFRPDNNVKLEEAVSAVLKMLGYSTSDFTGAFPEAQIAKYNALGLNTSITALQGKTLTRQDCMYLFYNLMSTKTKSGSYYATTLGYTVNSSGELDYSSLVLANMKGPFIVEDSSWNTTLPFDASTAKVYMNGSLSTSSSLSQYDVYYYNVSSKTIWSYRNKVTGVYTTASPNASAPSSVTVAGNTYSVSTSAAAYSLSELGTFKIGDSVTLLLGINNDVVGVLSASQINSIVYGFVSSTGKKTFTDSTGSSYSAMTVTVASTDGNSYEFECDNKYVDTGDLVQVSYEGNSMTVASLAEKSVNGTVNSSGSALGSLSFANDVKILDSTKNGAFAKIYPARLAGLTLSTSDVRYYVLNAEGNICQMILNDVTGDMYKYGILTSFGESAGTINYSYIYNGNSSKYSANSLSFGTTEGPVQIEFSGSSIVSMKNLSKLKLSSVSSSYVISDGLEYQIGDNACVYIYKDERYILSNANTLSNTASSYTIYGYYDKPANKGGRIRVIIAYAGNTPLM
ncbi:MAG: S-layer homology domain-containing protein [Firmicutes bacterium HGW-Firmicutes-16]|nr:MAG: S-layer homology domain-containing protein [Firmicutes bacterium HGW-Firmicutes-16]